MTSRLATFPMIQAVARRQMSAQAAVKTTSVVGGSSGKSSEAKVSTLDNGLTVVSLDTGSPVVTLGVVVKAGPRNEGYDNQGTSHALRIAAGLGTKNFTAFSITRNLQQAGAALRCTQGREHTFYSTQVLDNKVDEVIDYFLDVAGGQVFKPWEQTDNLHRMKLELARLCPNTKSVELLHRAAYRNGGLGNSLYSPDYMVGKNKPAVLKSFFDKNFTNQRTALVGIGIDHARLTKYASILSLESGQGASDKAKYFGGELRQDAGGRKAVINIAAEVSGADNRKDALAAMLLQRILGLAPHTKYGHGIGKLQKALGNSSDAHATGSHFIYMDSGLLGATITADAAKAGKAVETVAAALRSLSVSAEDLAVAKKSLLMYSFTHLSNPQCVAEDYGFQALFTKAVVPAHSVNDLVNGITLGEVQAVAKKLSGGKWSMSSIGNLGHVPYLDSL